MLPRPAPGKTVTDVKQVWFAGVHSDVGGGYANEEAGLSRIALAWMVHEAAAAGLRFDAAACRSVLLPDAAAAPGGGIPAVAEVAARFANAPAHDELGRRWLWKLLEWLPVPRYRRDPDSDAWYRHWLAKTLVPVEARLAQVGSGDFLFDAPGLFEVVLIPQMYNARRFNLDTNAMPHIERIEATCLKLPVFQRAHPDNQPDTPQT